MAYVLTETQMAFVRCPRDMQCFENNWYKRQQRIFDAWEAPKVYETHRDDYGCPFTVALHAQTGQVLEVTQ